MGVNSLPKTVTRQRRDCDLNPGPSALESSTLTTRLPSHPKLEGLLSLITDFVQMKLGVVSLYVELLQIDLPAFDRGPKSRVNSEGTERDAGVKCLYV